MGDPNQRTFLLDRVARVHGPILEIGSLEVGSTTSLRDVWKENEYVGVDLQAGPGVDVQVDLTKGTGPLPHEHFELAICCSVLEHTPRPWVMAENISRLVRAGGRLYVSVPWVWRYHPYPDDFFRISFRGVPALFPAFEWGVPHYSTNVIGEIWPIDGDQRRDDQMAVHTDVPGGRRKHLPYLNVNMIGVKRRVAP